jgi:hypothetical protein
MTRIRARRVRKLEASSRRALWSLIGLTAAICLPTLFLISRPSGPDLFDLTPAEACSEGYVILAWPELERARHAMHTGAISSGTMIRALGYMMEGDRQVRDGELIQGFVLLPDPGSAAHPAHRFGDQMINVRLETGSAVRFSEQSLVWVWGTLQMLPGNPTGHTPLYVLEHARAAPANKTDIQKYFK